MARMKKAEVLKALEEGTIVAVGKYAAKRALVQGVNQRRRVYSGARHDFSGHIATDGVLVQYVNEDGTPNSDPTIVGPQEVLGAWEAHSSSVAALRAADAERQAQLAARKARAEAAAAIIGQGATVKSVHPHRGNFTIVGYRVEISVEAAERLAAASQIVDQIAAATGIA